MNQIDDCRSQVDAVTDYFDQLADRHHLLPGAVTAANDNDNDNNNQNPLAA
jgi:hypothetical protein